MINPVWAEKISIGVSKTGDTWTYEPLCKGIEGFTPAVNEQNRQYFFMCGNGGADNEVTGIAPTYDVTGRRVHGDAAQDYIAGLKYKFGDDRKSSVKIECEGETITCDCTILNIVDHGGNSTDNEPFSCQIALNGLPTVTPA